MAEPDPVSQPKSEKRAGLSLGGRALLSACSTTLRGFLPGRAKMPESAKVWDGGEASRMPYFHWCGALSTGCGFVFVSVFFLLFF